jgi:hypothetical protein
MANIATAISGLLRQAREAGATPQQMAELRMGFRTQFDWNPTKKRLSPAKRKHLRKIQKESRRRNRGTGKGISNRKGQRHSL